MTRTLTRANTILMFALALGLAGVVLSLPRLASAAYNDVSLTTDTVLSVNGITVNVSGSTAEVESIQVGATTFTVELESGSTFQVKAPNLNKLSADTATALTNNTCNSAESKLAFSASKSVTVVITPSTTKCESSGGSSVGPSTTTVTEDDEGNRTIETVFSSEDSSPPSQSSTETSETVEEATTPATEAEIIESLQNQLVILIQQLIVILTQEILNLSAQ